MSGKITIGFIIWLAQAKIWFMAQEVQIKTDMKKIMIHEFNPRTVKFNIQIFNFNVRYA